MICRKEFKITVDAWLKTDPLNNPTDASPQKLITPYDSNLVNYDKNRAWNIT